MEGLEGIIAAVKNKKAFLYTEPEIPDFSRKDKFNLVVMGPKHTSKIPFKDESILEACGLLDESIFAEGMVNVCWNIKNLFTNTLHYKKKLNPKCKIFDLKIIEAYLGEKGERPVSYEEAMARIKKTTNKKWGEIYSKLHLPLITDIIPGIETTGVISKSKRKKLYAYYEIEGQKNGRFKCPVVLENGFNPHGINSEHRDDLLPVGDNKLFVHFDFKSMEVVILQWLSKDEKLKQILNSENDFYKEIFRILTGRSCTEPKHRDFCKSIFLPIIFGLSAKTISEKLKKSDNFSSHIINTLESTFPVAFSYVKEHQYNKELVDYLGRIRKFDGDSPTLRRNFVIQSPASTVCCEKLIKLKSAIKNEARLGFHVHDGYYLYVDKSKCKYVANLAKQVLESPSELLPDLKLRVVCKIGSTLNNLIVEK